MSNLIVGISSNERQVNPDNPVNFVSSAVNFADAVKRAGGLPFYLPIASKEDAKAYITSVDGLLLSGGQDVHPSFYGQEKLTEKDDYFLKRDYFELALLEEAFLQKKPILAICRGMQLLNVYLGGSLIQELPNHLQVGSQGTFHEIEVSPTSRLASLLPPCHRVNSIHHQSIDCLGKDLLVVARDPRDQVIEAVELPGYPLLALQWHPEYLVTESSGDQKIFNDFVEQIRLQKESLKDSN